MNQPIDLTKPVQTRAGCKVRILCTDKKGDYPVVGIVGDECGEVVRTWTADGRAVRTDAPSAYDLTNVPEKRTGWINIYQTTSKGESVVFPGYILFDTEESAILRASSDVRVATVRVEFEV